MSEPPSPIAKVLLTLGPPVEGDNLFGREREIAELWALLERQHVLMLAPRRAGKSSLMLRLRERPQAGFDVVYLNLEHGNTPQDFVARLIQGLSRADILRLTSVVSQRLQELIKRVKTISTDFKSIKLDLEASIGWRDAGEQVFSALRNHDKNVLIILDELPWFLQEMSKIAGPQSRLVSEFLGWFRNLRQAPELGSRARYLVGGSIGLNNVLKRLRLSAQFNDVHPYVLKPYEDDIAFQYLQALEAGEDCPLRDDERGEIIAQLGYLMPFHIQLVYSEVKSIAREDPDAIEKGSRIPTAIDRTLRSNANQLSHQVERLDDAFNMPVERDLARVMLGIACQQPDGCAFSKLEEAAEQTTGGNGDALARQELLMGVLDTLCHDGYLVQKPGLDDEPGSYLFVSHLLRRYWKRRHPQSKKASQ